MLSSLSCRSDEQVRSDLDSSHSETSKLALSTNNEVQLAQSVFHGSNRRLVHVLFVFILLAGNYIQCSESSNLRSSPNWRGNIESTDELEEGGPCFCDGRFYKSCPPLPSCRSNLLSNKHDDDHPDHVDDIQPNYYNDIPANLGLVGNKSPAIRETISNANDQVVRHRKIYVTERPAIEEPVIFPVSITIPVEFKEEPGVVIPPPKPIFKMHKYTTYETRQMTETVPVTTTIIKPVGVTKDQIISS